MPGSVNILAAMSEGEGLSGGQQNQDHPGFRKKTENNSKGRLPGPASCSTCFTEQGHPGGSGGTDRNGR